MGKGDARRPTQISEEKFAIGWCASMGHKMRDSSDVCINCGRTAQEIVEREAQRG
jgi:hypothetical protein